MVTKIANQFSNVYCNCSIAAIHPSPTQKGKVVVIDVMGKEFVFDHVVMAVQANHASKIGV